MKRLALLLVLWPTVASADKVVTQAWLRDFSKGKHPLAPLVNPKQGLVVLRRNVDSPADDFKPTLYAERLCGDKLAKALPALERELIAYYKQSDTVNCHNRPSPPGCEFGIAFEYTTIAHLVFRPAADGELELDTIMYLDGGNQVPEFYRRQAAWVQAQQAKLAKSDCL